MNTEQTALFEPPVTQLDEKADTSCGRWAVSSSELHDLLGVCNGHCMPEGAGKGKCAQTTVIKHLCDLYPHIRGEKSQFHVTLTIKGKQQDITVSFASLGNQFIALANTAEDARFLSANIGALLHELDLLDSVERITVCQFIHNAGFSLEEAITATKYI